MAGFKLKPMASAGDEVTYSSLYDRIQKNIKRLASVGMQWDEDVIKQSKSVGITEADSDSTYNFYNMYGGNDYINTEFIAFYDKEYPTRRDFLRRFAMNGEVETVLEILADESIIYDDNNYFAYPATKQLKSIIKAEKAKEIVDDLNESFSRVYYAFNFNNTHDAWHYFKKFLIDGFLSFEIIYEDNKDDEAKNIIAFKELDPISLEPEIRKNDEGDDIRVWVQYRGDNDKERILLDSNLIYISWARGNFISRLSYVERLVRSFNMLRTLENSRIIWNVWNSQQRMIIKVPIGTQSEAKARTRLSELRATYKEDININYESGEVTINGQPDFNFAKNLFIPVPGNNGSGIDIQSMKAEGYDLNSTEQLKYFWERFIIETKVPTSRFGGMYGNSEGSSQWGSGVEAASREEIRFSNFINRMRSIFQDILLKPTWIQFCLKHPEFEKDEALRAAIGLDFSEDNLIKMAKMRDIVEKGANTVTTLLGIKQPTVMPDGTPGEEPVLDPKFAMEKYMDFTDYDMKLNAKYLAERKKEMERLAAAYKRINAIEGAQEGGTGGDMGGDFGGGDMGGGMDFGGGDMGGGDLGGGDLGGEAPPEGGGEEAIV
jgi:uncharacterized membrane protein YgcG